MRQPALIEQSPAAAANGWGRAPRCGSTATPPSSGGGPAGLSGATWLARHRRCAVVVDSGEYRNRWVRSSHGYLGRDPASPEDMRDAAHRDLARYGSVRIITDRVLSASADGDTFTVQLEQASPLTSRRLVLATSVSRPGCWSGRRRCARHVAGLPAARRRPDRQCLRLLVDRPPATQPAGGGAAAPVAMTDPVAPDRTESLTTPKPCRRVMGRGTTLGRPVGQGCPGRSEAG
ncbi:hypothetical protein BH20ACT7_BH20ACT7_11260 [soil metagenome]